MGFESGLFANRKPTVDTQTSGIKKLPEIFSKVEGGIQVGRVTDIILNNEYPDIELYGGENSIGSIFCKPSDFSSTDVIFAKPFNPQYCNFPIIDELVLLFQLPSTQIGKNIAETSYYYMSMVNMWNHPHHNAYPNPYSTIKGSLPQEQINDYETSEAGQVRRVKDESTEIDFNRSINISQNTFNEKINIHPLLPFYGDVINQGRWGNSIRIGSTAKSGSISFNDWSNSGENGNPIMILRNGQPSKIFRTEVEITSEGKEIRTEEDITDEGWIPITENINRDKSSIYLTSTQQIPIRVASQRYFSYTPRFKETPTSPPSYTGDQVIINSGRLLFNSKSDHILLSSQRTISFEALKGFNFDTPANFVIDVGTHIKLGSRNATEPLVKGETLRQDLQYLTESLLSLVKILKYQQLWPAGNSVPDSGASLVASSVETMLKSLLEDFKKDSNGNSVILSKVSKTI